MAGLGSPPGGRNSSPKRVVRTGLALVHENEIVYPAVASEAIATRVVDEARADVHMHFPVVIEVVAVGSGDTVETTLRNVQRRLARGLRTR